jgi:uncharacterized membrane protein
VTDQENQPQHESAADQFYAATLPLDRFNAFSDGVFAIAITILVLELVAPAHGVPLIPALEEMWPDFLGYLISFAFIGGMWVTHSSLSNLMKRGDSVSYGLNLVMLICVCLLPFTTRVMVLQIGGGEISVGAFIYGTNVLLASLTISLLMHYVIQHPLLAMPGIATSHLKDIYSQRLRATALAAVAVVLSLVLPRLAMVLYLLVALTFLALPMVRMFRARK